MHKILVIEDQAQMRRNLTTILEMEGFKAISAENGRQGVHLAACEKPDLILCDIMMPELDGYGVLEALRLDKATATIPFIFLTAKGEKLDFRTGMNLGADDYLTKPVARQDLLVCIGARLKRKQAQDDLTKTQIAGMVFKPNFSSPAPLEKLGLTPREAEVLLWVAQGKSNGDVAILLGMSEKTVKKHMGNVFEKLGVESRNASTVVALEALSARAV
jgi:DNA-binding NarL/FixJ family response regulator